MLEELDVCFKVAAKTWIEWAQTRNRRPIKATSVPTLESALRNYINPVIGSLPLSKIHNGTCKPIVEAMKKAKLSSSAMNSYLNIVKVVCKATINPETGEPAFPKKWNAVFLDMPVIEHAKQPCLTAAQVESMLELSNTAEEHLLYLLLASTGLRIGECLALEWRHVSNDARSLTIEQKVNRFGEIEKGLKTKAGSRVVDVDPLVAVYLMAARSEGLLFRTRENTPHLAGNIERRWLRSHATGSWHQFRRFRNTHLRSVSCQPDLLHFWMGHKGGERGEQMSELYSKLSRDRAFRLKESERCGLGFDIKRPWYEQIVYKEGARPVSYQDGRIVRGRNRKQTVKA
jgi:integrase